jgi:hypothetical protein
MGVKIWKFMSCSPESVFGAGAKETFCALARVEQGTKPTDRTKPT